MGKAYHLTAMSPRLPPAPKRAGQKSDAGGLPSKARRGGMFDKLLQSVRWSGP